MTAIPRFSRRAVLLGGAGLLVGCGGGGSRPELVAAPTATGAPADGPTPAAAAAAATPAAPTAGAPTAGAPVATIVTAGDPASDMVALTFHTNGDRALVEGLLDALAAQAVPMTSFVVGDWLAADPDLGERLLTDGHDIGNHTYSHGAMGAMSAEQILDEIVRCGDVLESVLGTRGRWFRPSQSDVPTQLMADQAAIAGYEATIGFNNDPLDYQDPGGAAITERVTSVLAGGDIVSLHFGHPGTIDAIAPLAAALRAANLRPVTLSTLLAP